VCASPADQEGEMKDPDSPSVRERRLARELREARIGAQLAGTAVASATGWSTSKVSRIETGRIGISAADLDRLIELYRVSEEQAKYLRRLAPAARTRGWWEAYADSLSAGYAGLLRLESGSEALRSYCAVVPHPLLMTPEYIRHVVLATWQPPSPLEVERRIRVCLRRQAVLQQDEPHPRLRLSVVIDEAVLRRSVLASKDSTDLGVHLDQLNQLITAASWPNVSIQVLPFAAGIPPVSAGSFSILESRATGGPDVIYLENKTRIFFVDAEVEVDRYARDYRLLTEMALSTADSVHFIEAIADDVAGKHRPG
jgi:transcriptional regulator with XRE-family HTH domain